MEQGTTAEAMAVCEAAMASLRHHGLAPTPRHYAVWYEFHIASNPPLRRMLDAAMAEGRPIDPALMSELHDLHIAGGNARLAMREAGATLHEAAGQILEAGHDAARYGRTLHQAAGEMGDDRPAMTALVARLVEVTTSLSMKSLALGRQLQSSGRRISDLERQLAAAHREALTDPLTGLLNRRAFDESAREHAARAAAAGTALSALMLDIDHFKRVNDHWGHAVGDAVIRLVGATLVQICRPPAQAARYGGEEFAVLIAGHDAGGRRRAGRAVACRPCRPARQPAGERGAARRHHHIGRRGAARRQGNAVAMARAGRFGSL
ncbi:GGDEF domain-containing protein [Roseomonas sp. HJA6]|uniref:diguanylate cyclase n=1 Tax=Roseomonas alba TaxID=2846776 RepID=A0ABS7A6W4_9PROT|nr:GGDEF domain-containing protein [Neoroseomonas alba]MBW6398050.1 GGDEF domain-containing protein [Neoroseomonas alba]